MKRITYIGCIVTLLLFHIPYGILFILGNFLIYTLSVVYLISFKRSYPLKIGYMDKIKPPVLVIVSILGIGFIHAGYSMYEFYKYPITTDYTKQEFENKILSDSRENKINKILK